MTLAGRRGRAVQPRIVPTRRISGRLLDLTGDLEWNPESQDDEKTVNTAVITRRLRAMSVELITLADELERGADDNGLR